MKKTFSNIRTLAALLMAGAAFAACSNSDDIINEQPANTTVKQGYTLTVSASKDGSTTRALSLDGSAVVASWEATDEIVVSKNGTQIGTLSPTNINGIEATFTGTISGDADINVSDVLTLSYHPIASLSDFASQNGTLNGSATSAENFDMAVATVTISEISGKNIICESSANFVNQTAVVVLSPHASYQDQGGTTNISSLIVSVMMDIPEVGTVTEKIGPITGLGGQPYYFSLPSQSLLAEVLAAKYSLSASAVSTLLASATITFTGQQEGVYYLTCSKTGYKFAAGKYYKLGENNFVMTEVIKRSAADKDVYVESQDNSWSHTVTFAVNKEIGWKVVGDNVFCGDKQLYVVTTETSPYGASEGWVKASDDFIPMPFAATYSLREPAPAPAPTLAQTMTTAGMTVKVKYNYNNGENYCQFLSNGDGTYTFQSGDGWAGGDAKCAKALVVEVEGGKLVFKQNFYKTIDDLWDSYGFSVTFDTSNNTYSEWRGKSAAEYYNPSFISVEVNGTTIAVTPAAPSLLSLTVYDEGGYGIGEQTFYYSSGETWEEAIINHPTENDGWSIEFDDYYEFYYVQYNDLRVYNSWTGPFDPFEAIDSSVSYAFQ